jgi:penicillin-binding protein 1A
MVSKKINYKKTVKRIWLIYFSFIAFIILLFFIISKGWLGFMPSFEELENPKSNLAAEVISADQVVLGTYFIENRSNVHFNELSPFLVNALIATEDARFEKHSGIDTKGMFRVFFKSVLFGKKSAGGGSTITQQLAKNLFPRKKHQNKLLLIFSKLREWITAIKLERNYTKDEIISMYYNTVDFGSNAFGIRSASKTYFGKEPSELKIEEAAMLVGMLKAPTRFSPVRHKDVALQRRDVVLYQMYKYNYIKKNQYDSLKIIPIDVSNYHVQNQNAGKATYFREYIRQQLDDWCDNHYKEDGSPYNLYKDGLKIYTTINSKMQQYAEEAVREYIGKELQPAFFRHWKGHRNAPFDPQLTDEERSNIIRDAMSRTQRYARLKEQGLSPVEIKLAFSKPVKMRVFSWKGERDTTMSPLDSIKYYKFFLRAGLMSMEPQTGFVRAYVGGINYKHFKFDQVMQAKRQVGSTFKPFIYTLALQELGYSPCKKVPNIPVSFDLPDGTKWIPDNAEKDDEGKMVTLKYALANSITSISAYLMKRLSPGGVIELARKMGVTSQIDAVPSICLGTPSLSLYEMVGAMSTFADKGVYIKPVFITRIEDKNGKILDRFATEKKEAMSEETAYLMIDLLKGVVLHGTSVRLIYKYKFNNPIAGKTGTTQNYSDGWFMGLTPNLVSGVWVGCEDRSCHFRSMQLGQGANEALPIWAIYMRKVYNDKTLNIFQGDFERPAKPLSVETDCSKYEAEHKNESSSGNEVF